MENKFIAILLVLIIFIYMFINPNEKLEPFINIEDEDINKSLENIIEDSETLKLLNKNNKVESLNYKNDSKKFLKDLKKKYEKYYELKTNTNFNNYGQMCQDWQFYDKYKNIKGNDCKKINGDNYQCIIGDGKLTSCSNTKLYDKNIKNNINRNKEIKKSTIIYQNSFTDIDKSLEYYSNLLDKEIKKYKAKQDIIVNQEYLLGQQKNYNKLQKKKLNNDTNSYNQENDIFNLNFNKSREEKLKIEEERQTLSSIKFYSKCCLTLLAIIIFIKMLFIKI
jgi:hypothetical protein